MRVPTSLAALMLRLTVGVVFFAAGAEKVLRGPDYSSAYFESMSVVWPSLTGPLVSWFEVIAGAGLIIGLLTVPFAMALAAEMLVVLLFIRLPDAALAPSITDAITTLRLEALLAAAAAAIALLGPGSLSLDHAIRKRLAARRRS
jgi:putative oxidoreductase